MIRSRIEVVPLVLIGILALLGIGSKSSVGAAALQHFSVRQVRQLDTGTPSVRAYLDLRDSDGNPMDGLPPESLSATLGQWPTTLTGLESFDPSQQGVAYVFLVDISRSLSNSLFGTLVAGLEEWIGDLNPLDRASIIAFGDSSVLVADFTNDSQVLQSALRSLGPTDSQTVLHQALLDALELSRRLDPDLPGRRAIVIFSDGKDEGSSRRAEDVLDRFRDDPTPIYALGYSGLRDAAERQTFLSLLDRFTTQSGGASYEVQQTRFAEAYTAIRAAIGDVWVADFSCEECQPDSTVKRLQIQVDLDGKVLADGVSIRLMPAKHAAAVSDGTGSEVESDAAAAEEAEEEPLRTDPTGPSKSLGGLSTWLLVGVAGLLVLAAFVYRRSLTKKRQAAAAARLVAEMGMHPTSPLDPDLPSPAPTPGGPESTSTPGSDARARAPRRVKPAKGSASHRTAEKASSGSLRTPKASKAVRLVVIRGSRQGKQYSVMVKGTAVVGHRSDSDCVLIDEPGVDSQQFELYFDGIKLYIRNLSEIHPTLVNGQTIPGRAEIASDTLIGTDATILKVVYE